MNRKIVLTILLVIISLLMIATAVFAEVNPTSPFETWDDRTGPQGGWRNSNTVMELPGPDGLQPFGVKLSFDNTGVDACNTGQLTRYAGELRLQHMHEDNTPDGAIGFGVTGNWVAVKCSEMVGQRTPPPSAIIGTCSPTVADPNVYGACEVVSKDVPFACPQGNCKTYWETTVRGSLDLDCNGIIDANEDGDQTNDIPTSGNGDTTDFCFYWTAVKPPPDSGWQQPLQSRVASDGGDRTVTFSDQFIIPTAVSLVDFAASESALGPSIGLVILLPLGLLGLAAAALLWRRAALD